MANGIVETLKALEIQNLVAKTVDVYYDSKALTESHRNACIQLVTVQIEKQIKKDSLRLWRSVLFRGAKSEAQDKTD